MTTDDSDRTVETVLIVYATVHGCTAEIAEFIATRMRDKGLSARVVSVDEDPDPTRFDEVVLGSAIHYRAFLPGFSDYIDRHCLALRVRPAWLFSVGFGPAIPGLLGFVLRHYTPGAIVRVRNQLCPWGFGRFAGEVPHPDSLPTRVIMWLLGCGFGDLRDWPAIAAWTDAITAAIVAERQRIEFQTVRVTDRS
ncbi:flavodoxin domain-containing protein [Nocardia sp. CA-119907]|uniref:flavodoxin domain-containing protein n=1 Tax=Nocardia sp. CA-119907 TaxID=3239973 RepID=UPI003D966A9C